MTELELMAAFERCTLPQEEFSHETHVRLAWLYLRKKPLADVLSMVTDGLRQLTAHYGVPGLYHETITCAYIVLVNQGLERTGRDRPWSEFAAANPDLLQPKKAALLRYYRPEELDCQLARDIFVLPGHGSAG
ncbi:MAG: hypothetical protein MJE77_13150 [Proteobacteria bacterium]|nr:hypothetical protein [Pseudomonadota bacterium]